MSGASDPSSATRRTGTAPLEPRASGGRWFETEEPDDGNGVQHELTARPAGTPCVCYARGWAETRTEALRERTRTACMSLRAL